LIPDTYRVQADSSAITFSLAEGATTDVSIPLRALGNVPATFEAIFNFPDATEFPSGGQLAGIFSSCWNEDVYWLPKNFVGVHTTKAFVNSACTYSVKVGGRTQTLDQTRTNTITVHHLDVDDVTVTREDRTTYRTSGTYEIYYNGGRIAGPFQTHSGLELLPGTYELVIQYNTVDGAKTQRQTFTL
jgi:hypothetical protein